MVTQFMRIKCFVIKRSVYGEQRIGNIGGVFHGATGERDNSESYLIEGIVSIFRFERTKRSVQIHKTVLHVQRIRRLRCKPDRAGIST